MTTTSTMQARSQMLPGDDIEPQIMNPTAQSRIGATSPCAIRRRIPVMALPLSTSKLRHVATPGADPRAGTAPVASRGAAIHYSRKRRRAIRSVFRDGIMNVDDDHGEDS